MNIWLTLRLLGAVFFFAVASLTVFRAPTFALFKVALVATEFGHWLFLAPLLLALLPAPRTGWSLGATALALIAAILFLSSAVRASVVAARFPADLERAFPRGDNSGDCDAPFSWKTLWFPVAPQKVAVATYTYATRGDEALHLLYYRPVSHHPAPCIVVIHGGGWEGGSPDEFPGLSHLLAQRGYAVAAIEYRFAPRWTWPAQREDVHDALSYLRTHADELGLDPQRFVLLGRSAGGQIAEAVAYGAHDPTIRGCIAFYAPADIHFAYEFARADDILNSLRLVRQYMGGTPQEVPQNYDSASGILLAEKSSPPTLLIHGSRDELAWVRQSARLDARLTTLGAPHYFLELPWATHAFDYNLHGPGGQLSTYAVEAFLQAILP
jgi:acetyl esterase/lipase